MASETSWSEQDGERTNNLDIHMPLRVLHANISSSKCFDVTIIGLVVVLVPVDVEWPSQHFYEPY
jgi:hypothetical protein